MWILIYQYYQKYMICITLLIRFVYLTYFKQKNTICCALKNKSHSLY